MGKYLDEYIRQMLPELSIGGGATLDELITLAEAIQADLAETPPLRKEKETK